MKKIYKKVVKKALSVFLVVVMLLTSAPLQGFTKFDFSWLSFNASAASYSGTCGDNVTWVFDDETGILTLDGTGEMKNYNSPSSLYWAFNFNIHPWKKYCSQIKTIIINDGITAIGNYAFARIDSLESVVIPESVLSIGTGAFGSCISLESIAIYNNETTFGAYSFGYDYTGETLYPDLLIYGTIDSSAHEYANNNGITFQCIHAYNNEVPIESDKSSLICGDVIKYTCTECGQSWDDSKAIAHDYELVSCVCDCITGGVDTYTCSRCGDTYTENFAARHADTDNDGFCDYCLNPFGGVLDLVFIIDSTGSMSDEINVVKESIQTYADMLSQSNIPHYIALVDFSNDKQNNGLNNYYNINFDFTNDEETIAKGISNLTTKGGSDEPAYSAIINGLEELHWGVNSTRRIILIGDEEPWSNETVTGYNYDKALESLQNNDISVYSIATGGTNVSSFRTLAESTNGNYYQSSDSAEFADTLIDIIDSIPESIHLHDYAETIITSATCLKDGLASYKCTGCGRELENVVLSALGHNYVSKRIEATDELEEHTRFTCSRCNDSYIVLDPATPVEGLQAFAGTYTVSLSWLKSVEASVTGYKVYRKLAADTEFALIKTISSRNTTSFVDKDLTAGYEYVYVITALKEEVEGLQCDPVVCIPNADEEEPRVLKLEPSKMLNDVITGTVKFALNAEDNIGVVKFELYYSPENSGEWNLISEYKGATANISFNTKSVSDGTYSFKAIAYDAMGNSGDGSLIKTYVIDNSGPDKVTGLNTKAVYASKATIAWNNVSDKDINHFILRRKTDTGYEVVSNSITGVLGYNLEGLSPNTQYTYSVAGVDHYGNIGEYSDDFSFTTLADTTAPVVTSLSPASGRYNSSVSFKATATDDCGIASITIQTSLNGVDWEGIKTYTYSDNKTSKTCTHTISLQNYNDGPIYIRAVANDIVGNKSNTSESAPFIQYYVDKTAPSKPTGVTAVGGDGYIQIKWNRSIEDDLSGYYVYRSTAENGTFTKISGKLSTLNHYDRNVNRDTIYYYKVDVVDSCGNVSEQSAVVSAKALSDTIKPTIESISPAYGTAISVNNNQIGILANDNNMLKSIVVEYKYDGDYEVLKTFDNINTTNKVVYVSLPISNYKHGDVVYLRAYCIDASGYTSEYSSAVKYAIDKVAPGLTNLSCAINSGVCTLKWNDINDSDLSGFKVYRSTNGGSYKSIGSRASSSSHSYTFNDTVSEGTHKYRIDCVDKSGNSASYYSDSVNWTKPAQIKAIITGETYLEQGVQEVFSASKSTSDNSISSYLWDFGDGTTSNKINVTKAYNEAGVYTVTLKLTDSQGNVSTASKVITVAERELLGTARVRVVNENGYAVSNAPVYFDLGEENQQIVYTNTSGYASLTMTVGTHVVGSYKNGFLPVSGNVTVLANTTAEITLTMVEQELITGEFEVHEMTFEEIKAAGIDVNDPANQQIYEVKVTLIYGEEKIPVTYVRNDTEIISYTIGNTGGAGPGGGGGGGNHGGGKINHISFVPNEMNQEIIAVVEIPITASYLKQFYSANLHIVNNAAAGYEIVNCEASISVPDGLTVVQHTPISSVIDGQQSSSANWILRGDKAGSYNLSANFSGVLDSFNVPVSASFTADEPVVVYGPETVKLRMEVNEEIQYDTLYFNIGLVNQRPVNVNCPRINTVDFVKNVTESVKNNEAVIDGDEYECELLNIRVDHGDGTCTYFEPDSTSDELAEFMNTLPPGAGLFYEYVVYDLIDYDDIAYFNKATIECAEDYFGAIEVISMDLHKFDEPNYDAIFSGLEDDEFAIMVVDSSNNPVVKAKVLYDDIKERTDEKGVAIFQKSDNDESNVTISKKGYRTLEEVIDKEDYKDKNYEVFTLYSDKESIYNLKNCYYIPVGKSENITSINILSSTKRISSTKRLEFKLKCEAIETANVEKYELWCSGEILAESNDGLFSGLSVEKLRVGKGYGINVVPNNGEDPVMTSINLELVEDKAVKNTNLEFNHNKQVISVNSDVPFIGGTQVEFDLLSDSYPLDIYVGEDKVHIGLNVDLTDDPTKTDAEKIEEMRKDFYYLKNYAKTDINKIAEKIVPTNISVPGTPELDAYLVGYGEGLITNGSFSAVNIEVMLVVKASYEHKWYYAVPVGAIVVPVIVKLKGELKGELKGNFGFDFVDRNHKYSIDLTITPKLEAKALVGIDFVLNGGAYGSCELPIGISLVDWSDSGINYVDLTGELGLSVELVGAEGKVAFAYDTWHIYTSTPNPKKMTRSSVSSNNIISLFDISTYKDEDLSYVAENTRDITEFENHSIIDTENNDFVALVDNVYTSATPSVAVVADNLVMAYADVNRYDSDNINTEIMYSVYDVENNKWNEPDFIDRDNLSKYSPELINLNDELYLTYQKRTSLATLAELGADSYFGDIELVVAKFNTETKEFDTMGSVSYDDSYVKSPQLCNDGDNIAVVFMANSSTDPFGTTGSKLVKSVYNAGKWNSCKVVLDSERQISTFAVNPDSDKVELVYAIENDGNLLGNECILYHLSSDNEKTELYEGTLFSVNYDHIPGTDENGFIWTTENNMLYTTDELDSKSLFDDNTLGISDNYVIVGDDIFFVSPSDKNTDVYMARFTDLGFINPVKISDEEEYIENLCAIRTDDKIHLISVLTDVNILEADIQKYCTLSWSTFEAVTDISLDAVYYDFEKVLPLENLPMEVTLCNQGTEPVDEVEFVISADGETVSTQAVKVDILSGESDTVDLSVPMPENITLKNYKVECIVNDDVTSENNYHEFEIGYSDISLESEIIQRKGKASLIIQAVNESATTTGGTINVYAGDDNKLIDTLVLDKLEKDQSALFMVDIDVDCFDGDNAGVITAVLETDVKDCYENNNSVMEYIDYAVYGQVTEVELSESELLLKVEDTYKLTGKVTPDEFTVNKTLRWESNDESVAIVDKDGNVTAVGIGETTVIAKSVDGALTDSCNVIVVECTGHKYGKWSITEQSSCKTEGKQIRICEYCEHVDEQILEKLKHTGGVATCKDQKICSLCNEPYGELDSNNHVNLDTVVENEIPSKCGIKGSYDLVTYCSFCKKELSREAKETEALKHKNETVVGKVPTCTETGLTDGIKCSVCGETLTVQQTIGKLAHNDYNGDYMCDYGCGYEFEKPADPTPDVPDKPTDSNCGHICHKSGFMGFIWKIVRFFWKLFKINPICSCGAAHY